MPALIDYHSNHSWMAIEAKTLKVDNPAEMNTTHRAAGQTNKE